MNGNSLNRFTLKFSALFLFASIILFNGCFPENYKSTKTSLELQAFQAKEFDTSKKIAFASSLSVFQDLGYIIGSGDLETGLISAQSPTQKGMTIGYYTQENRQATAFIETIRKGTARIRLNFVDIVKGSSSYGSETRVDKPIEDPKFYQEIFEKIEKAIFVRRNVN